MRTTILLAGLLIAGFALGDFERGNRLYREGRYEEAVEAYQKALEQGDSSPQLHYNLGTALLRLGRYEEAQQHLQLALASVDPDVRPRATYNLGTTYLEAGRAAQDPAQRSQLLDAAVEQLKNALRLNPADMDAKWNLELALQERQEPPPSGGGGGDDDDSGNDSEPQLDQPPQNGGPQQQPGDQQAEPPPAPQEAPLTPEEAERILNAVQQSEREVYREQLRRDRRDVRVERDW